MYCHKALTRVCLRHIGWPARVSWLGLAMTSQWIGRIGREFSYRICQVMQNSPNFETLDIANQDTVMDILMRCGTYVSTICQLQTNRSTQLFFWSMGVLAHWLPLKSPLEAALCFCCRRTRFLRGWRFCKDLAFFLGRANPSTGYKNKFQIDQPSQSIRVRCWGCWVAGWSLTSPYASFFFVFLRSEILVIQHTSLADFFKKPEADSQNQELVRFRYWSLSNSYQVLLNP